MANPSSATLGVIGCGAQCVSQIHALGRIFPLERVVAFDTDPDASRSLASRCPFLDVKFEVVAVNHLPELVETSDILCTCTSAEAGAGPVFAGVMVVPSAAMARKLAHDVPQLAVPETIIDRVERHPSGGVDVAVELIDGIRASGAFDGVHLIPVSRYRDVEARLSAALG